MIGWFVAGVILIVALFANRAAYYNGCTDGYGAAKEPWNPFYQKARTYLKTYMSHRFVVE